MANRGEKRRILSYLLSYDTNLIVAVIFLIVFGLIMIYSASYYTASMRQSYNYDPTFLLKSQLKYSIVGLFVMLLVFSGVLSWPISRASTGIYNFFGTILMFWNRRGERAHGDDILPAAEL